MVVFVLCKHKALQFMIRPLGQSVCDMRHCKGEMLLKAHGREIYLTVNQAFFPCIFSIHIPSFWEVISHNKSKNSPATIILEKDQDPIVASLNFTPAATTPLEPSPTHIPATVLDWLMLPCAGN